MNTKQLIDEAVSLPVEERVLVADTLLRSLNQPESEIDKKWIEVGHQRLAEFRSGAITAIPGEIVFQKILAKFDK
ncbi:MAG: addiction module protein [Leptospirales bacterium]